MLNDFPFDDDLPLENSRNEDEVPHFLEDDDLTPQTHPLFNNLPRKVNSPTEPLPPSIPPEEKQQLDSDVEHFLTKTGRPPRPIPVAPILPEKKEPSPLPAPSPEVPPPSLAPIVDPAIFEDELLLEAEDIDDLYEDDDSFNVDSSFEAEEEPPLGMPPPPPAPEIQSTFVNPALARIAAARRRSTAEPSELWLGVRAVVIVVLAALIVAFIFSYWTPESFLSAEFIANLQEVSSTQGPPTAVPSPLPTFSSVQKIGIITGHSGPPLNPAFTEDPGAICDENGDGIPELRELDINTSVSYRVADLLIQEGFLVEMLNEWDPRLDGYRADTLISIHTNTCENLGFGANGFNVSAWERSPMVDRDNRLVDCMVNYYTQWTALPRHYGSPPDLVDYHAFRQVSIDTPTVIVELGFMFADRQLLTERPNDMAQGLFEGILCFLSPQDLPPQTPTAPPS